MPHRHFAFVGLLVRGVRRLQPTITVTVTDKQGNQAIYAYTGGSASGEVVVAPPP